MTSNKQYKLSRRSSELAQAVPQVVAMRVGRMMGGGLWPAAHDQQELYRMGAEKVEAFNESWQAMASQAATSQQQFARWWMRSSTTTANPTRSANILWPMRCRPSANCGPVW